MNVLRSINISTASNLDGGGVVMQTPFQAWACRRALDFGAIVTENSKTTLLSQQVRLSACPRVSHFVSNFVYTFKFVKSIW